MTPARPRGRSSPGSTSAGFERLRLRLGSRSADEDQRLFEGIAGQVAKLRYEWDLSQRELAELCGTTQSAIARLERGARPPRIDTLQRVARALDSELVVELRPRTLTSRSSSEPHPR